MLFDPVQSSAMKLTYLSFLIVSSSKKIYKEFDFVVGGGLVCF